MPGCWMSLQGTCPGETPVLTVGYQGIFYPSWGWEAAASWHKQWAAISKALSWRTCFDEDPKMFAYRGMGKSSA